MIDLIPLILLTTIFILMLIFIAKDVMERTALAVFLAALSYLILLIFTEAPLTIVFDFMVGSEDDGFGNLRTIMLIFGFSVLSFLSQKSGLFQFIAFKIIQMTKGNSKKIMIYNSLLSFAIVSVLSDYVTAIIMIPLTITICRTLKLKPVPFIILQAMYFKLGATVFPISSIPGIMISNAVGINFLEYFLFAGFISLFIAVSTLTILMLIYQKKQGGIQESMSAGIAMFLEYDPWTFVKDKVFMQKIAIVFTGVIISFLVIDSSIASPDMIAVAGAAIGLLINKNKIDTLFKEIDLSLLVYLVGVFVITGSMQYVGIIEVLGAIVKMVNISNFALLMIVLLWLGAIFSAFVDNIPITQLLIPIIQLFVQDNPALLKRSAMGMGVGITWGDNLTPFGDTILVLNIAKTHGVDIDTAELFRINSPITFFQLLAISVLFILIFDILQGLIVIAVIAVIIVLIASLLKANKRKKKTNKESQA